MKKFIAAILLAVFTLSGCDIAQRYAISPEIYEVYSEYRVDKEHMDNFDGMFTINVCGYDLTFPMMESDLPEGFTLEGSRLSSSKEFYSSDLKYDGIYICYICSVDSSNGKVITGVSMEPLCQTKIHFANGAEMNTLRKEDLDELFGGHKGTLKGISEYAHIMYSDGKRLCVFDFYDSGYRSIALYCDPVTMYRQNT